MFALFLSDLEEYFVQYNIEYLKKVDKNFQKELDMYMEIFLLLYADDTILLSETEKGLQQLLNAFCNYCKQWKLSVNLDKTKVIVFSKRKSNKKYNFTFDGDTIQG